MVHGFALFSIDIHISAWGRFCSGCCSVLPCSGACTGFVLACTHLSLVACSAVHSLLVAFRLVLLLCTVACAATSRTRVSTKVVSRRMRCTTLYSFQWHSLVHAEFCLVRFVTNPCTAFFYIDFFLLNIVSVYCYSYF